MQEIKKNEQYDRIKLKFEELQKNLEDLQCKEHSKTKTIYVDQLPSNKNKGGFICEYCPNPSHNLKFYSNIIEENADLINRINKANSSEKANNLNEDEIKHFSELFFQVDQKNNEFNKSLKKFDSTFLPDLFTKKYGDNELKKLNDIIKTISFNQKGKPIYENIGQNKDREVKYVKLANILLFLRDYKFSFESKFSEGLYAHIEDIISQRDNFNARTNDYMRFITGDFYTKVHEIDNIPYNEKFLKNKKLFIDDNDKYLLEFNQKLQAKDDEINGLNDKIKKLNADNLQSKNTIENLMKKNNELLSLNKKQENLIKELQNKLDDTCVQSLNSQGDFDKKMVDLNNQFESKMNKLEKDNKQLLNDKDKKINELSQQNNKLRENNGLIEKQKNEFHEKTIDLNMEISNLRSQNEKKSRDSNNDNILLKKEYEEKIYILKEDITQYEHDKNRLEKELKNSNLQIEEILLTRKHLGETYTDEKNAWVKNKQELLAEIERLKKLNQNSIKLESLNKELNKKIENNIVQIEYLTKKNEEMEKNCKNCNNEKQDLQRRIETYIIENNSLTQRLKSMNGDNKNTQYNTEINYELLNDLKKQVAINKTLNVEIESMQDKINNYNNRLSNNEKLINNQLELIKKYQEEKPILSYDRKNDLLNSNMKQTQNIIDKIEKIENDPLKRSLNVPIQSNNVDSYIRNSITNSDPKENLSKSQILHSENPAITGNKYNEGFRPSKVLYKINFSEELLLNNTNWEMVRDWIDETNTFSTGIQPKLLLKATKDGFKAKDFQDHCINIQNILILAKTDKDKLIGGFSPLPWMIPNDPERHLKDITNSTFIFSLSGKEKYLIKKNMDAICVSKNQGPIYGLKEFEIRDNCDTQYSTVSNFGKSFETKRSAKEFFGDEKYLIKEYEVYQII